MCGVCVCVVFVCVVCVCVVCVCVCAIQVIQPVWYTGHIDRLTVVFLSLSLKTLTLSWWDHFILNPL